MMLKKDNLLMLAAVLLLLVVDWLAFHDIHEVHTARDWLMLIASALVFIKFGLDLWKQQTRKI